MQIQRFSLSIYKLVISFILLLKLWILEWPVSSRDAETVTHSDCSIYEREGLMFLLRNFLQWLFISLYVVPNDLSFISLQAGYLFNESIIISLSVFWPKNHIFGYSFQDLYLP